MTPYTSPYQPMPQPWAAGPYQPPQPMGQGIPIQAPQAGAVPPAAPVDDRIWVQGEAAAQAYLVAANGFVRLWDSTAPVFYEKRADPTGRPFELEVFEYKRLDRDAPGNDAQRPDVPDYGAALDALRRRVEALEGRFQPRVEEINYD